uniref:Gypsy retrotransposon integrase-like protein 1 n=1 Tax=Lygus hesperus TaxID=30085 RepID=A0A0A9XZG8_LYGHE
MADYTSLDVDDPSLVVVNLEHCVSSEGAHLGKNSCIYTTTMPTTSCHDMLQLTTPVQCLGDINQSLSRLHQHSAQLLPLQYPQVQVSYENASTAGLQQGNSILPPSSIYQSSTLHYSQAAPFLTPLPPQPVTFLEATPAQELPEQEIISLEPLPPLPPVEECKHPAEDCDYYKEIENYLLTAEVPLGASDAYIKNLKTRAKHYLITDGVLHHNPKNPKRVVTTKEEQLNLLENAHVEKKTGIHQGIIKMHALLHEKYFWRGMHVTIANYTKKCNRCRDTTEPSFESDLSSDESEKGIFSVKTQTNSTIWNEVEVSVHGPFKITSLRNEFVVTIADPSSCFVVGTSISQHGHCTKVAQFILRTFHLLGFPYSQVVVPTNLIDAIRTELNWCLKGKNAMKLVKQTEDTKMPWIAQLVAILVKRFPTKWDKELDRFLYQFRTGGIKQLSTKFPATPFYSMFNRKHCLDQLQEDKENARGLLRKMVESKWTCRKCNKSFNSRVNLRLHMKSHKKHLKIDCGPESSTTNSGAGAASRVPSSDKGTFSAPEDSVEVTVSAIKAVLDETKSERKKRGRYQKYSTKLQLEMASYANKYGSPRAAEHFSKILGTSVSDSTIRNIVKSHSQFTPSLKEEIGKYAVDFGIDQAASHFSERMNKSISVRMVRRFKTLYLNKTGGDAKDKTSKETEQSSVKLKDAEENSSNSIDITSTFTPISCQTTACFAQPTSIAPLTQNSGYTMQVVTSTYGPHPSQQIQDDNESVVAQHFLLVTPEGGHGPFEMSIQANKDDDNGSTAWVGEFQSFQVDPHIFIETCTVEPVTSKTEDILPAEPQLPPAEPARSPSPPALKKTQSQKKDSSTKRRGAYSVFSPELRAEIGKYAAEHGSLKASYYFSETLGQNLAVAESTARALKQKYLEKVKHSNVTSLGYSPRGRPLRLGKYDEMVQECLRELLRSGERVSSFLAITTAKEVLNKFEPELLEENGGPVVLNTSWAKSFLKRNGFRNNS